MQTSTQCRCDLAEVRSWWRDELAAVEAYAKAIEFVHENPLLRTTLQQVRVSHQRRCTQLEKETRALGGEPEESSGECGDFAKLVEGSARQPDVRSAIAALEVAETRGLRVYQNVVESKFFSRRLRNFVACELLQEQRSTTNRMTHLVHIVDHAPCARANMGLAPRRSGDG